MKNLKKLNFCIHCIQPKEKCPYPGAFNTKTALVGGMEHRIINKQNRIGSNKIPIHQSCSEAFDDGSETTEQLKLEVN